MKEVEHDERNCIVSQRKTGKRKWGGGRREEQWEGVINESGRRRKKKKTFCPSIYCEETGGDRKKELIPRMQSPS